MHPPVNVVPLFAAPSVVSIVRRPLPRPSLRPVVMGAVRVEESRVLVAPNRPPRFRWGTQGGEVVLETRSQDGLNTRYSMSPREARELASLLNSMAKLADGES